MEKELVKFKKMYYEGALAMIKIEYNEDKPIHAKNKCNCNIENSYVEYNNDSFPYQENYKLLRCKDCNKIIKASICYK